MELDSKAPIGDVIFDILTIKSKGALPEDFNVYLHNWYTMLRAQTLNLSHSLSQYKAHKNDLLVLMAKLKGGDSLDLKLDPNLFEPYYDRDFKPEDYPAQNKRGGKPYYPPFGWKRLGLKVIDKYDEGDRKWLGMSNIDGEWAVSYHGMRYRGEEALRGILREGYKVQKACRQAYGKGNYSSPKISVAGGWYAYLFRHEGCTYRLVFQNRYNPKTTEVPQAQPDFLVSADCDIRPYGLLFLKE